MSIILEFSEIEEDIKAHFLRSGIQFWYVLFTSNECYVPQYGAVRIEFPDDIDIDIESRWKCIDLNGVRLHTVTFPNNYTRLVLINKNITNCDCTHRQVYEI